MGRHSKADYWVPAVVEPDAQFDWRRPTDLETMQIRIPLTTQEKSTQVRSAQVDTYKPAERKILLGVCLAVSTPPQLLVTRKGQRYDTPTKGNHPNFQIPNGWYALP